MVVVGETGSSGGGDRKGYSWVVVGGEFRGNGSGWGGGSDV